jgi:hypothetical protein
VGIVRKDPGGAEAALHNCNSNASHEGAIGTVRGETVLHPGGLAASGRGEWPGARERHGAGVTPQRRTGRGV